MRLLRRILAALLLTLGALLLGLLLLAASPGFLAPVIQPLRMMLVDAGLTAVSRGLAGTIEIGALEGSLLSDPVVRDLRIVDAGNEPILELPALALRYEPWSLFRGALQIDDITIEGLRLHLSETADGSLNLVAVFASDAPKEAEVDEGGDLALPVNLDRATLRDGELNLGLSALPGVTTVSDLAIALSASLDARGLEVRILEFTANAQPADVQLKGLEGGFRLAADEMELDNVLLATGTTRISVDGRVPGEAESGSVVLALEPLDVNEVGRILGDELLVGTVRGKMEAKGPLAELDLSARFDVPRGQVDLEGRFDVGAPKLRYGGRLAVNEFDITSLVARPEWESDVTARLHFQGEGSAPADIVAELELDLEPSRFGAVDIGPSRVSLAANAKRVEVREFELDTSILEASASGHLDFAGESSLAYRLSATLADLGTLLDDQPLQGEVRLRGGASGSWPELVVEGLLEARDLAYADYSLETLDASYQATDLGGAPHVSATVAARQARVGAISVEAANLATDYVLSGDTHGVEFALDVKQSDTLRAALGGRLSSGQGVTNLTLVEIGAQIGERAWSNAAPVTVTAAPDRVEVGPLRVAHADEAIELSGGFVDRSFRELKLRVVGLDIGYLRDTFALPAALGGRLGLRLELDGPLHDPKLESSVALEGTADRVVPFERGHLDLDYRDKVVTARAAIRQADREALRLSLAAPVDLAFEAIPLDARLQEGEVLARLELDRLDLGALTGALLPEPSIAGTLSGRLEAGGSLAGLEVRSNVTLADLSVAGVVDRVQAPIELAANLTAAESLAALQDALRNGELSVSLADFSLISGSLTANLVAGQEPASLALEGLRVAGSGSWDETGLTAAVEEAELEAAVTGYPPLRVALAAELNPQVLGLNRLQVKTQASAVEAAGLYRFVDGGLDFELSLPLLELREFVAELPAHLPSQLSGEIKASGTQQAPVVDARLRFASAELAAHLDAALAEQPPSYSGDVRISNVVLDEFSSQIQGRLGALLAFRGTGFAPAERRAELTLEVDSDELSLLPGLKSLVEVQVRGETVAVPRLDLSSAPLALQGKGTVTKLGVDRFDYTLRLLDLAPLAGVLGVPVEARGELDGSLEGSFEALQSRNRLALEGWRYGDWQGGQLTARLDASGLLTAPTASGKIEASELTGPGLAATALALEGRYGDARAEFSLAALSGPFENSRVAGQSRLAEGVDTTIDVLRLQRSDWTWENDGPIRATLDAAGDLSLADLVLSNGKQRISASATVQADGRLNATAQVQRLLLGPAAAAFVESPPPLSGELSVEMQAEGTLARPVVAGDLEADSLRWDQYEVGRLEATVATRGSVIDANASWLHEGQEVITTSGSWDSARPQRLDVEVRAEAFDLGRLQPLSSEVLASSGRLDLELAVTGTLEQPQAVGAMEIRDGELQLAVLGERFRNLQSEIVFSGRRVDIRRLEIESESGTARIDGWLQSDDLSSFRTELALLTDNFTVINTPGLSADLNAEIGIRGTDEDLDVSGKVVVPKARVRYEALPASGAATVEPWQLTVEGVYGAGREAALAQIEQPTERTTREPPNLDFLRTNLAIEMPRNTWVQGSGTAVELTGKLRVVKRLREPFVLSGSVATVRGSASVMGRRFEIERGTVTFQGTKDINPFLEIVAFHQRRGYTIYVEITGESKKPQLVFRSIPELEQADIISLLVFGRTQDKLSSSEQNSLSGRVAGSVAAGVLEGSLGASLGLDSIAIDLGDETSGGSVGVGRYISNDVFLSYERTFRDPQKGNRGGNTVGIEYTLTPRIKLRGTGSDFGETAVDIFWQVDY